MDPIKEKTKLISENHRLEFGPSSWDPNSLSLRNRYDLDNGKFDRVSSQEIPVSDLALIIKYAAEVGALNREETMHCLRSLLDSLESKLGG